MTAAVYGIGGQSSGLTPDDVYEAEVEEALRALAQNTSKYGMVSLDLLNAMADQGPQVLHAIAAFENNTIQWNLERGDDLRFPLAFIFPSEGTFWTDQPYCILDRADWVNDEEAEAATLFLEFLKRPEIQALAVEELLRPLDSSIPLKAPLDLEHGTDPRVRPETVQAYEIPDGITMQAINDQFLITKRKATVFIVLDVSGSMSGEKIRAATDATVNFLRRLDPSDRVRVVPFSDRVSNLGPAMEVSKTADKTSREVRALFAAGGTALNVAVCRAVEVLERLQLVDRADGEGRLYGVVLLSDGQNTDDSTTDNQIFTRCLPNHPEAEGVKVFPIAFGDDADVEVLQRIADVTGGKMYKADPDSLERIYLRISAEQ